jgi:hypothetical protein
LARRKVSIDSQDSETEEFHEHPLRSLQEGTTEYFPEPIPSKFRIYNYRHADVVLKHAFPSEYRDLVKVLSEYQLLYTQILEPGGNKGPIALGLESNFSSLGWAEKKWDIDVVIDGDSRDSPTHTVDYYRNRIAVETEWNNKDPFFDRDLNNFRLLHALDVISVGVIITRATELHDVLYTLRAKSSYGASTTHHGKILPKIAGGGAAECPLLIFAIKPAATVDDRS